MPSAQIHAQQITLDIHEATGGISPLLINQLEVLPWGQTWANGVLGSDVTFLVYTLPQAYLLEGNTKKVWRATKNKGPSCITLSEALAPSSLHSLEYFHHQKNTTASTMVAVLSGWDAREHGCHTTLQQWHCMVLPLAATAAPGLQLCSLEGKPNSSLMLFQLSQALKTCYMEEKILSLILRKKIKTKLV